MSRPRRRRQPGDGCADAGPDWAFSAVRFVRSGRCRPSSGHATLETPAQREARNRDHQVIHDSCSRPNTPGRPRRIRECHRRRTTRGNGPARSGHRPGRPAGDPAATAGARVGTRRGAPASGRMPGPPGSAVALMTGGRYEFVVAGVFGPQLRSMFADLEVEDRPGQTLLVLHSADDAALLSMLTRIADDDRELERIQAIW